MSIGEDLQQRLVGALKFLFNGRKPVALNDETLYALMAQDFAGEVRLVVPYDLVGFFTPLMASTVPEHGEILYPETTGLPQLPIFHVNLVIAKKKNRLADEMADFIRRGFLERQQRVH